MTRSESAVAAADSRNSPGAGRGERGMGKRDFDQEAQELYLVFGGRVADPQRSEFADVSALDVRGIFPTYEKAFEIWRGAAQATVDDALMKYVIVRLR